MPNALISVSDQRNLIPLAIGLVELGWDIIASGGTAERIRAEGVAVRSVENYTGLRECLDGRVKTLHPAIHAGILARNNPADQHDLLENHWEAIDLVVANLYPFEQVVANDDICETEAVENIDIGGVALIRAAAKNFERVLVLCDPDDYEEALVRIREKTSDMAYRRKMAARAFRRTTSYDYAILNYLEPEKHIRIEGTLHQELRYGENPHQTAKYYTFQPDEGLFGSGQILQGKPLSYNNYLDLDTAWKAANQFEQPAISIVKHSSPCGIAVNASLLNAYKNALKSDPVSAFGSVIAANRQLDGETAQAMKSLFVECIIAPGYDDQALSIFSKKKNLRLLKMQDTEIAQKNEFRSVIGGFLVQSVDVGDPELAEWRVVSQRQPSRSEWDDLRFAWKAVQYSKSNAILFAKDQSSVGIGSGQPNRVDCVHIAAQRAGEAGKGAVMASDAFFPFADSVEAAANYGITAIVEPGGSIRDEEVIAAADRLGLTLVFTGVRHFRH